MKGSDHREQAIEHLRAAADALALAAHHLDAAKDDAWGRCIDAGTATDDAIAELTKRCAPTTAKATATPPRSRRG